MASIATIKINILGGDRSLKAMHTVIQVLKDVSEDFGYRDDVKRAIRAARYLGKHLQVKAKAGE